MKSLLSTMLLVLGSCIYAQADEIVGRWKTEKGQSHIEIFKKEGLYHGKIVWLEDNTNDDGSSPARDLNNPDQSKRQRTIEGLIILRDLRWTAEDQEWQEGKVYDPESGDTYDIFARLKDPNTLYLKGYIGISLLGRSTLWSRID